MAFAITIANLIETMKESGCPICTLERKAARKTADGFLYENMMNPGAREQALSAHGFCAPHTRMVAGMELARSGEPLGISMLYETLNNRLGREIRAWRPRPGGLRRLLQRAGIELPELKIPGLHPASPCPICVSARQAGRNSLTALMDELQRGNTEVQNSYQSGSGLCLNHLRAGLEELGDTYPQAGLWLAGQTAARLEEQAGHMRELVRKKNWAYRSEQLTAEEAAAWRHALAFYTGYAGESFQFESGDEQPYL